MLALKPRIETTIRILLIVIILFNALSPTIGSAKSSTAKNTPIDALGRESQGPESEIPLSSSNFSRPIPRIGERQNNTASTGSSQSTPSQSAVEALPITFIENVGQFNENELFQAQISQGSIHIAKDAIWISAIDKSKAGSQDASLASQKDSAEKDTIIEGVNLRLSFVGSDAPQLIGFNPLDTTVSYFLDNDPINWYPDVPVWGGVTYQNIYPGIDLEMTSQSGNWLWQIVAKNQISSDKAIKIKVEGSDRVTKEGKLFRLHANGKDISLPVPEIIFDNRTKHKTPAAFVDGSDIVIPLSTQTSQNEQGKFTAFDLKNVDQSSTPGSSSSDEIINNGLIFSTVLRGGTAWDMTADASGSTYVTGPAILADFPTTPGAFQTTKSGVADVFVTKLNTSASSLIYSTYVGGSNDDFSRGITIGTDGTAYVTGKTLSPNFPVISGSFDTIFDGGGDAFAFKLNNNGTQLAYSTFLGGSTAGEEGLGIALDGTGSAYVVGQTTSSNFPTTIGAYDRTFNSGLYDGFVLKINPSGSALSYSTYLGGASTDCEVDGEWRECTIAVNSSGEAYIAGTTASSGFPTTSGAFDQTYNGGLDAFVAKMNSAGSGLVYSTFLGGSGTDCDRTCKIAIDGMGNAYISGTTSSTNFPIAGSAFDSSANGGRDIFVSKLNVNGSSLAYSTYIGGGSDDYAANLALNSTGEASVFGYTQSAGFPVTVSAYQGAFSGGSCGSFTCRDAVLLTLAFDGSKPVYSTFLGGHGDELGYGMAQGQDHSVFVTGWTNSGDFPTTAGTYDTTPSGDDAFVSRLQIVFGPLSDALTNSSNLGLDGNLSCVAICSQEYEGGPINTRTGGYDYSYTDISLETDAGPLKFERTYSSLATGIYSANLGYGWTHNHDMYLVIGSYGTNGIRQITLKGHTANQYTFTQRSGDTQAVSEFGVYAKLVQGASSFILTDKAQDRYEFNLTSGQLISYKNANGRTLLYTYDAKGKLKKISDQSGQRFLSFAYSGSSTRIDSVTDHTGRSVNYYYDASGDLDYVIDVLGQTWRYEYQDHLLIWVVAPGDIFVERTIYAQGKAIRQYNGAGYAVELTYNADGTTTVTDAMYHSRIQTYDRRGTLTEDKNFYNAKQQTHYDVNFRPDVITDALQNPTYLTWSGNGANLTKIKDALQHEIDITYGAYNNPVSVIDASDHETKYFYTDANFPKLPTRIEYPLSFDGITYVGTDYEYYPPSSGAYAGKVKFVTDALGNKTYYTYTTFGQTASATIAYGTANAITTTYAYDNLGRLVDQTTAGVTTHNEYNAADQLTKTTRNYNTAYTQNYQNLYNLVTEYRYDSRGNQIAIIDTYGVITRTYYNGADWPVTVVQNLFGQTIETTTPPARGSGGVDKNIRTDMVYAGNGNVIATIDSDNVITRTYYDQANRPVTVVQNFIGELYSETPPVYDPAYPDQNTRSDTVYDENGNAIAAIDTNGVITRTYYDQLNRPVTVVQNLKGQDITVPTPPVRGDSDQNVRTDTVYDDNGNVIATIDPENVITRTYYDAMNRPVTVVQNLTGDIYATTPPDRTQGATSANIRTDTYYDKAGNVIATVDPRGVVTRTYYDGSNRPVTVVKNLIGDIYLTTPPDRGSGGPDQNVRVDTVYDGYGRKSSIIDPLGRESKYEYDQLGQLKKVTVNYVLGQPQNYQDKFNIVTEFSYDALGRSVTSTDTLGRINRIAYDDLSRVLTNTVNYLSGQAQNYKDASGNRYNIVTSYTYDIRSNQIAITDTANAVTRTYFDRLGRPTAVVRNLGQAITDPTPPARGNPPDPLNNIRTDTVYLGDGTVDRIVDEMGKTTIFDYDDLGRQTLVQDPLLNSTVQQYSPRDELVLIRDANLSETKYEYDPLGRLSAVIENYRPGIAPTQEINVRTEYIYDANGNRLSILDGRSHSTSFTYDALNRLKTETDALGHGNTYGYDLLGNRVSLVDANQKSTGFQYDELNRLYQIDYPSPDADVTFIYDPTGRRTSMSDGLGSTGWNYDNLDRPTSITDPFGTTVAYDYDQAGNRSLLSYNGITVNYQYDALNRLAHVTGGMDGTVDYGYDAASRLKSVTRPNGINTSYQYYDNGWLQNLTHASTTTTFASYEYTYDAVGNRKRAIENILWPGVAVPTSTPSPTSTSTATETPTETPTETLLPTFTASPTDTDTLTPTASDTPAATDTPSFTETPSLTPAASDTPSPTETPTWTPTSSDTPTPTDTPITGGFNKVNGFFVRFPLAPKTPTPSLTPTNTLTATFTASPTNTVTALPTDTATPTAPSNSTPTDTGTPTATSTPSLPPVQTSVTIDYVYDPLNRLKEANYSSGDYYHYAYDEVGNRLSQEKMIIGLLTNDAYLYDDANRLTSVNGLTYTWDDAGNLLNDGVNTYTYDSANRLKSIAGASTATFAYNGLGDRLAQNNVTYTLDLNAGLTQVLADGTNAYIYGLGRIAERQSGVNEYYLGDVLGSVRQIVEGNGALTLTRSYDPFGNTAQTLGTAQTDFGFTGEFTDPSGLIYLRARYYESITGRFTTKDTYEGDVNTPATLNRFNYAHSNPVMNTDPSGHCVFAVVDTFLCSIVLGAAGGFVIGGAVAGWIWDAASEGTCGCAETMQVLSMPRSQFVHMARIQGAIWGAAFGFVAGTGPLGGVAAGLVGMGMSTVQLMDAATKLRDNYQDKCAWIQFGAAMVGLGLAAAGTAGSYNYGVSTGRWIGWEPLTIGGGPRPGWKVGDLIDAADEFGNYPEWETVRSRYWQNRAVNSKREFSPQNLARMKNGDPPRVRIIARDNTGEIVELLVSKELHHIAGRNIPNPHNANNLVEVWPWEHAAQDPSRFTGYTFLRFK